MRSHMDVNIPTVHLGRLCCLEGDVCSDPESSGLLPLGPDLLLGVSAAGLVLQVDRQGLGRLVEACGRGQTS